MIESYYALAGLVTIALIVAILLPPVEKKHQG